jgi:hypothetical protein
MVYLFKKILFKSWAPVAIILAIQEAEIKRIVV